MKYSVLPLLLLSLFSSNPLQAQPNFLNPTAFNPTDTVLSTDDGTPDELVGGIVQGYPLILVNRLTPNRYPATLKAIRVYFAHTNPSPVSATIRLIVFASAVQSQIVSPTLLVNQNAVIPSVSTAGEFVEFAVANGPTITSGDFFVGYQQPARQGVPYFWVDTSEPQARRAYASINNGQTYEGNVRLAPPDNRFINLMIRAVVSEPSGFTVRSAASFGEGNLAPEQIVAGFGTGLAGGTAIAINQPLPTVLGGSSVRMIDSGGVQRLASLFFVSSGQINFLVPPGTPDGPVAIEVVQGSSVVAREAATVARTAPGLFAANANGQGPAAAVALRVQAGGASSYEPVVRFVNNRFEPIPINLGPPSDQVFLILYGTGIRGRSSPAQTNARLGGVNAEVSFAGPQDGFAGLDQLNVHIPRSLAGRGEVDVEVSIDGKPTNKVRIAIGGATQLSARNRATAHQQKRRPKKKRSAKVRAVKF